MQNGENTQQTWNIVIEHVIQLLSESNDNNDFALPSERKLAEALGVGRQSVREALKALQILGLLKPGVGSGPTAGNRYINESSLGFYRVLSLYSRTNAFPVEDLVDLRIILEQASLVKLAERVHNNLENNLHESECLLADMREATHDPSTFLHLDSLFHVSLARASGNRTIGNLMEGLRGAIEAYFIEKIPQDWPIVSNRLLQEHEELMRLIQSGGSSRVAAAIRSHILGYHRHRL